MSASRDPSSSHASRRRPQGRRIRFGPRRRSPWRASRLAPALLVLALVVLWLFLAEGFVGLFTG